MLAFVKSIHCTHRGKYTFASENPDNNHIKVSSLLRAVHHEAVETHLFVKLVSGSWRARLLRQRQRMRRDWTESLTLDTYQRTDSGSALHCTAQLTGALLFPPSHRDKHQLCLCCLSLSAFHTYCSSNRGKAGGCRL